MAYIRQKNNMKTERLERGINARAIQQRGDGVSGVSIEDNRKKGSRNYLSGAPLQRSEASEIGGLALQRKPSGALSKQGHESGVAQREFNDATGRFVYVTLGVNNKFRIPYHGGIIYFTEYQEEEIRSAEFSGCFMMAFRFNTNKAREVAGLFPANNANVDLSHTYVAHVPADTREAVQDAEYQQLIFIDALFRPANRFTDSGLVALAGKTDGENLRIRSDTSLIRYEIPFSGMYNLTGGMEYTPGTPGQQGRWKGTIYRQERIPDAAVDDKDHYHWANEPFVRYDEDAMNIRTFATKAYIYVRVILDTTIPEGSDRKRAAHRELLNIKTNQPRAIHIAMEEICRKGSSDQPIVNYLASF